MKRTKWMIFWSNDDSGACGVLSGRFDSEEEAEHQAEKIYNAKLRDHTWDEDFTVEAIAVSVAEKP